MTSTALSAAPWLQSSPSPAMAALRCCCPSDAAMAPRRVRSQALIRASMEKPSSSESMAASSSVRATFSSKMNKVYEDKSMGILCYTDDNGETVCEGLDEGPRLTWQDMENLRKEREHGAQEDRRDMVLHIAGGLDWIIPEASAGIGKN